MVRHGMRHFSSATTGLWSELVSWGTLAYPWQRTWRPVEQ